jgi:diacylglycerol kinase (CTP)
MELRTRSDIHLTRKIWHFLGVSMMACIAELSAPHEVTNALALALLTFVPIDLLRQRRPQLNTVTVAIFQPIMRNSELDQLSGISYLLTGVAIIVAIFPPPIITLSLLFLACADPIASYFGLRYGKRILVGRKTVVGTTAAFVACAVLTLGFCLYKNMCLNHIWFVTLLGGLGGALSEALPLGKLDDNFTLPLLSSFLLFVIFYWCGGITL